ncbi:hypothetical protein RRG08_066660 [Elysia crispata]|uniref:Uncharacterized protein n=1 Tax=Elysia crispata TaxID=231223 RepID=A0AAE1AD49_9GAST|nr:hypothetical protein RRG08_066660 [Elysia crispata]
MNVGTGVGIFQGRGYWCWDHFMDVGFGVGIFHGRGYWCWDHFMNVGTGVGIISWTWVLVLGSFHGLNFSESPFCKLVAQHRFRFPEHIILFSGRLQLEVSEPAWRRVICQNEMSKLSDAATAKNQ